MQRFALLLSTAAVLAGCEVGGTAAPPATSVDRTAQSDVVFLVGEIERIHPNPWANISEREFRTAASQLAARFERLAEHEQLVELMRLVALLGDRNGHNGIYPLDESHRTSLHLFPVSVYAFPDGVHVVAALGHPDLVGARVLAVAETPIADVMAAIRPLVSRDNQWSQLLHSALVLPTAEVLHGLGIVPSVGTATFTFELPNGRTRELQLEPMTHDAYMDGLSEAYPSYIYGLPARRDLLTLRHPAKDWWLMRLRGGRVVYANFNHTTSASSMLAERLRRLARRPHVERVVVDVRHNGGGDNTTYWDLLDVLASHAIDRPGRLYCLIGRSTFSAATNFVTDLEREAENVVFVGEPTGGSPNMYGDAVPVSLPRTGWTVHIAPEYIEKSDRGDPRLAVEPDVDVAWPARDFFAGNDPILRAALAQ